MNEQSKTLTAETEGRTDRRPVQRALPLRRRGEPTALSRPSDPHGEEHPDLSDTAHVRSPALDGEHDSSRALAISDISAPGGSALDAILRYAYRIGVPGAMLAAPFRKPGKLRLLAQVDSPLAGERQAGTALRAGYLLVHGVRAPISQIDFASSTRLVPPFQRMIHGFHWMRDLSACAPAAQCAASARQLFNGWLEANALDRKGPAWSVENTGHRLLNWLIHAPVVLAKDDAFRSRALEEIDTTARWLDRAVRSAESVHEEVVGWTALVAAGLLLPDGKPRRLYAEAGLFKALGDLVSEDGGVLSRSPLAQMDVIALLTDLRACYEAVDRDPPAALESMLTLLVPPLLALRHGDGGLGNWQGAGAVSGERLEHLLEATGVRARPGKDMRQWGYQRVTARDTVLQFDAAPPPRPRDARFGCASTLAFELSSGEHRIVVNCGGAELAGGMTPVRIEKGLRATAAHSTLVLDDANSTAVLIKGQVGKGVEEVDISRSLFKRDKVTGTRLKASHDGYASRFGLLHERVLMLRDTGGELHGEDLLLPAGRKTQRGMIGYAIRFHLGPEVSCRLTEDRLGALLTLADGTGWQFRMGGDTSEMELSVDDSLWVDGQGRPHGTKQLVATGLVSRGGGRFPWLLRKIG